MKLALPKYKLSEDRSRIADIAKLAGCSQSEGPVCRPDCNLAGGQLCTYACPQAAQMLSSDDAFPIESGILPLVFELKATRIFEPVWSCEGHYGPDGRIFRKPSIWFCCESLPQTNTLADVISSLCIEIKAAVRWRISFACLGADTPNSVFQLEPICESDDRLEPIHRDMTVLAERLRARLSDCGRRALSMI